MNVGVKMTARSGEPIGGSERQIIVLMCVNDDYGSLDRLRSVEFADDAISVESIDMDGVAFRHVSGGFAVSGTRFAARHVGSGVGNVYWNSYAMPSGDAARFLCWLRDSKRWNFDSGDERLWRWWSSRIAGNTEWLARHLASRVAK